VIVVVAPGALTTLQGRGAPGLAHLGVSAGGAADPFAAALANLLVENPPDAGVLEVTFSGPTLRFEEDALVAVVGAAFSLALDGEAKPSGAAFAVVAGQTLRIGTCARGLRAALAVRGGLAGVEENLALPRGARLVGAGAPRIEPALPLPPYPELGDAPVLRVTPGPEAALFDEGSRARLQAARWRVLPASDRRGVRLAAEHEGEAPGEFLAPPIEMTTQGVTAGAIQVPPSGRPVILFVDQQTTGGYPRLAHVIRADLWRVGQLRPGDVIGFETVDFETARELYRRWRSLLTTRAPAPPSI
jgi:allophanate hydrolase subunit 2